MLHTPCYIVHSMHAGKHAPPIGRPRGYGVAAAASVLLGGRADVSLIVKALHQVAWQ